MTMITLTLRSDISLCWKKWKKIAPIVSFMLFVLFSAENILSIIRSSSYVFENINIHWNANFETSTSTHYRQVSNIRRSKSPNLNISRLVLQLHVFAQSMKTRCKVENEDVVGVPPRGDAPTTSEWSTIVLPTKVRSILTVIKIVMICKGKHHQWLSIATPEPAKNCRRTNYSHTVHYIE